MATNGWVTFTPSGGTSIGIGQGSDPFPAYSITSEPIRKDRINLGIKYNITVTGTLIITSTLVDAVNEIVNSTGLLGTLTIGSPAGVGNLTFTDCMITSFEAAQQDDVSRGTQNQDYTLSFESYQAGDPNYQFLEEFSESWETSVDDSEYFDVGDENSFPTPVITITQTVSATGRSQSGNSNSGKSAYTSAKEWVLSKVKSSPFTVAPLTYDKTPSAFLGIPSSIITLSDGAYNRTRQRTDDIVDGTCSVTTTWKTGPSAQKATSSIEFTYSGDQNSEAQTVEVSITINGLSSLAIDGGTQNKYDNAESFYETIKNNISGWALAFYNKAATAIIGRNLNPNPISTSRTDNRTDGTITISQTFDDKNIPFPGASSVSVNITYTNEDGGNNIVAILPVIAKTNGPIIQNMQTTGERKRSVALDVTMNQSNRTAKPTSQALGYVAQYEPNVNPLYLYRENMTETWNPITGAYTLNLDYVWTDSTPL